MNPSGASVGADRGREAPGESDRSPDGVDLTLIRYMLGLTPLERLAVLQDWVDGLAELADGRPADR